MSLPAPEPSTLCPWLAALTGSHLFPQGEPASLKELFVFLPRASRVEIQWEAKLGQEHGAAALWVLTEVSRL